MTTLRPSEIIWLYWLELLSIEEDAILYPVEYFN